MVVDLTSSWNKLMSMLFFFITRNNLHEATKRIWDRWQERLYSQIKQIFHGRKQSPRKWNKRFDEFIVGIGFECSKYDTCTYFKFLVGLFIILLLYVDDILIANNSKLDVRKVKSEQNCEFEMKDMWIVRNILGIEISIWHDLKCLYLS